MKKKKNEKIETKRKQKKKKKIWNENSCHYVWIIECEMNVYGLVTMTSVLTIFINDVDDFLGQL